MTVAKSATTNNPIAKLIGALFLLQMFAGIWLNFFFYKPLFADPVQLSNETVQLLIGVGVLMAITLSTINFTVCLVSRSLLNGQFQNHFVSALSFSVIALCLTAIEANQLSEFANWIIYSNQLEPGSLAKMGDPSLWQEHVRQVLATGRNKSHFMAILISSLSLLMFYSLLLRARLLPASLMYFAVAACALQLVAVGHSLFGQSIPVLLQLPLAVNQLVLPLYLLIKGFNQQSESTLGDQA